MKKFLADLIPFWLVGVMLLGLGVWHREIMTWTAINLTFPVLKFALWIGGGSSL